METVSLVVELRKGTGKGAARAARRNGKLPAILYGPRREPRAVQLDWKEFVTRVASVEGSHLIRLESPDGDLGGKLALVKDIQLDPVSGRVLHTDLYEVDEKIAIRVRVPLRFVGKAAGVERGGILQPLLREIEVSCLPADIPEYIEVDVAPLGIHEAIHISALKAPRGVEVLYDSDQAVVTILPPTVEEKPAPEEAAAAEAAGPAAEVTVSAAKSTG